MAVLEDGALFIETKRVGTVLKCLWRGESTARRPGDTLHPFFEKVMSEAAGAPIEMRFEGLQYFNSSTVAAFIKMIKTAAEAKVALVMVYDEGSSTHRASFESLKIFEKGDGMLELRTSSAE